jgi:predicted nucleic acid-binding protein
VIYWDTSAIITLLAQGKLGRISGTTRPHTLTEFYARTTGKGFLIGGRTVKLTPELAAQRIEELRSQLTFVVLTAEETAQALCDAAKADVRGGRTHDFLHFAAAKKAGSESIYTFNQADFAFSTIPLKQPLCGK